MHPQIIGRSHRMQLLEKLILFIKDHPGVWFATASDVASLCREEWDNQVG
jgi:hypothetical protein